ncbi:COG1470 family protein [Streptomyces sp. MUM 178J]|uniref:COG1470 family protein n=1 Tax=Streptomyces sp. MUM 178J TaxID=2791991 RepID=UPI001F039569|nr:hypothetical protein [Streptomyces sp. MUM 178J]WRQ79730.1 hypothetical protein I3F59_010405 [Streptomyces sp. MUM 178J]
MRPPRRPLPSAAVLLACMVAAAAGAAAPGARAAGDGWSAVPASGDGAEGRPYAYLEGAPGTVLEDRLSVVNRADRPLAVTLSTADGIGDWIALAAPRVTVPPRTRADVPFSVTVPGGAPPGEHTARIVVRSDTGTASRAQKARTQQVRTQQAREQQAREQEAREQQARVQQARTQEVRIRLRVAGPTLAALTVEDVSIRAGEIHYTLVNRGNTVLAPRLALHAEGLFGTVLDRTARALPLRLRPGQRAELTEPWPGPPSLDSVDVRLTVTADGRAARGVRAEAEASAVFAAWPWAAAGCALAAGAAYGAARLLRRAMGRAGRVMGRAGHTARRDRERDDAR